MERFKNWLFSCCRLFIGGTVLILEIALGIVLGVILLPLCIGALYAITSREFWKCVGSIIVAGLGILLVYLVKTDKDISLIFGLLVLGGINLLLLFFLWDAITKRDKQSVFVLSIALLLWLSCIFTSATFLLALISTFIGMGIYLKNHPVKEGGEHEQN